MLSLWSTRPLILLSWSFCIKKIMTKDVRKKINEILDQIKCPKGFTCAETGFKKLCKARNFGNEFYLECLEKTSPPCPFALVYDYGTETRFCSCPLRVYLAKNLGK